MIVKARGAVVKVKLKTSHEIFTTKFFVIGVTSGFRANPIFRATL
jgi:hypothetical protein